MPKMVASIELSQQEAQCILDCFERANIQGRNLRELVKQIEDKIMANFNDGEMPIQE